MRYNFFLVFILAHLTGDFVFQTNKIAKVKAEGIKGLLMHCTIISAVQVIFLSIFGVFGILAGVVCGFIHFFIDYSKNILKKYFPNTQFFYFLLDQAMHIAVIYGITLLLAPETTVLSENLGLIRAAIGVIVLAYVATIAVHIFIDDLPDTMGKEFYLKKFERPVDAVTGLLLWGVWLLPFVFSLPAVLALAYLFYKLQNIMFDYKINISGVKYVFYAVVAYLVNLVIM